MTEVSESMTVGARLRSSEAIETAVRSIVDEVGRLSAELTDIKPPSAELRESYDDYMKRAAETRGRALLYPYLGSGIGNGALVELLDGSVKWDMITGIGVNFFGHSEPDLLEAAIRASLEDTVHHGNLQANWSGYGFAETLLECASKNSNLKHCFLSTSGVLANENALKLCFQKHAPASRVIAFKDCFMGRTLAMSQIGDSPGNRQGLPLNVLVDYMPFYSETDAERMGETRYIDMAVMHLEQYLDRYPNQHACFIFELVQGEGGFNAGTRDYFKALMQLCRDRGVAVWDDEVQTFGRGPTMFAYEHFELGEYVDLVSIGKMSQACATLFTENYNPKPGLLSATFTGSPIEFEVGRRSLERLRDGDYYGPDGRIARNHKHFCDQVWALRDRHPEWFPPLPQVPGSTAGKDICGGHGGMMRMSPFGGDKQKILKACRACFDEGVIVFYCGHGPYHMRMLPPLGVFDEADWPRVFESVERGLSQTAEG